jgi:hypothetical protein
MRTRLARNVLSCFCVLVVLFTASNSTAVAQSAPAGLRIFTSGHSFHVFVPPLLDQLARKAGIQGHHQIGLQSMGGSTVLQHCQRPQHRILQELAWRTVSAYAYSGVTGPRDDH